MGTDNLAIDKDLLEKYFTQGDLVRIMQGNHKGETGMVTDTSKGIVVKMDRTQREVRVNKNVLKIKGEHDNDMSKLMELNSSAMHKELQNTKTDSEIYKVSDIIMFNEMKSYGYIIQVQGDMLKVICDQGSVCRVRLTEIDQKIVYDKKAFTRDSCHNILSIDDVVKCNKDRNPGKKGIVKNICKSCVFLWDPKDFAHSSGIFVESPLNVLILGTEFLKTNMTDSNIVMPNKIGRDKML